jgi:lysophospholipase L1-like esterase
MKKLLVDVSVIAVLTLVLLEFVLQVGGWIISRPGLEQAIHTGKHIKILCLGDSHTYGLFLNRDQAWPSVLEKQLRVQGFPDVEVVNLAYPGTNSHRVRYSIEAMMADVKPDYVIMMLGSNDYWTTPLDIQSDGESVVARFMRMHVRLYKLYTFLMRTHDAHAGYFLEDTLRHIHEEPEIAALENIKKVMAFYQIEVGVGGDGGDSPYAVWQDNKLSLKTIVDEIKNSNVEGRVWDKTQEITDTGTFNLMQLKTILTAKLHIASYKLDGAGGVVGYGNSEYRLGSTAQENTEKINGKQASADLADNLNYIIKVVREGRAEPLLMTYHFQVKYVYANDVIRRVAEEDRVPLIDIHSAILSVCKPFTCRQLLFTDLHPNIQGQIFIADNVRDFLLNTVFNGTASQGQQKNTSVSSSAVQE